MKKLIFHSRAWEDYLYWQSTDRKILKRINNLIQECHRTPFKGTGSPEPLKYNWAGFWSRRITREHRLVYSVTETELLIAQCRFYYE